MDLRSESKQAGRQATSGMVTTAQLLGSGRQCLCTSYCGQHLSGPASRGNDAPASLSPSLKFGSIEYLRASSSIIISLNRKLAMLLLLLPGHLIELMLLAVASPAHSLARTPPPPLWELHQRRRCRLIVDFGLV